jgi:dsRNA-specific ribonuclease
VTDRQRSAIAAVIGRGASPEIVHAIRDARGRTFQRLEFLGDPLLELMEGLVDVVVAAAVPQHDATTDHALSRQARALGAADWLEWSPSDQRLADLVEAVAGAAYLTGGWRAVGALAQRLRGPLPPAVLDLLDAPADGPQELTDLPAGTTIDRAYAALGASVLEASATLAVYDLDPDADEGALSALRRERHVTRRIAAWARTHGADLGLDPLLDDAPLSDAVEHRLGSLATIHGPAAAIAVADRILREAPALGDLPRTRGPGRG